MSLANMLGPARLAQNSDPPRRVLALSMRTSSLLPPLLPDAINCRRSAFARLLHFPCFLRRQGGMSSGSWVRRFSIFTVTSPNVHRDFTLVAHAPAGARLAPHLSPSTRQARRCGDQRFTSGACVQGRVCVIERHAGLGGFHRHCEPSLSFSFFNGGGEAVPCRATRTQSLTLPLPALCQRGQPRTLYREIGSRTFEMHFNCNPEFPGRSMQIRRK